MRTASEHRRAALGRAFTGACVVAMIVTVVIGAVGGTAGSGEPLVLTVAVLAALTASVLSPRSASPGLRMSSPSRGASGHVEASTAYWCALAAPQRPQRPRAPGRV